jgi:hypothetical protein
MSTAIQKEFPDFIFDLLQPTPSCVEKILAAWDGLCIETQLILLSKIDDIPTPVYLIERVKLKALGSPNAYVRYLAAHKLNVKSNYLIRDKQIQEIIENDSSPLVKYSLYENCSEISSLVLDVDDLKDADTFFALPHLARLAKVRMLSGYGEKMTAILTEAAVKQLHDGSVSERELYEIITDYLVKPKIPGKHTGDVMLSDACEDIKDELIEPLWQLVPQLPSEIDQVLIDNLPRLSQPQSVPDNVIEAMGISQLECLLNRRDIELPDLRKKLFRESAELRGIAVSSHFTLTYEEFAEILTDASEGQIATLKLLGTMAPELELCLYDAINDILLASESDITITAPKNNPYRKALVNRLNKLKYSEKKKELVQLRLYRLARTTVPWEAGTLGTPLNGALEFLSDKIIPCDTWRTFMAFSQAWSQITSRRHRTENQLPRLHDLGLDDYERDDNDSDPCVNDTLIDMNDELSQAIASVSKELKNLQRELQEGLGQLGKQVIEQKDQLVQEAEVRDVLQKKVSDLHRKNLFIYLTLGMLGTIMWLLYGYK